jgi:hypothetical protein
VFYIKIFLISITVCLLSFCRTVKEKELKTIVIPSPKLISFSPKSALELVNIDSKLVLEFDVPVEKRAGYILISTGKNSSGDFEEIDVLSEEVVVRGKVVEITCSNSFLYDTDYNMQISPGSFRAFHEQKNNSKSDGSRIVVQEYFDGILAADIFKFKTKKEEKKFIWGQWGDWGECLSETLQQERNRTCTMGSCIGKGSETRNCSAAFKINTKNVLSSITKDNRNKKIYNIDLLILYTPAVIKSDNSYNIKGLAAIAKLRSVFKNTLIDDIRVRVLDEISLDDKSWDYFSQTAPISELPLLSKREGLYYKNCYFNNRYLPYSDPSLVSREIKNLEISTCASWYYKKASGADLFITFGADSEFDSSTKGIAYTSSLNVNNKWINSNTSFVMLSLASGTLAHEIGHNLGATHCPVASNIDTRPSYAHGYPLCGLDVDGITKDCPIGSSGEYAQGTIMCSSEVLLYSSPTLVYEKKVDGNIVSVKLGDKKISDVKKLWQERKQEVANFDFAKVFINDSKGKNLSEKHPNCIKFFSLSNYESEIDKICITGSESLSFETIKSKAIRSFSIGSEVYIRLNQANTKLYYSMKDILLYDAVHKSNYFTNISSVEISRRVF